MKYREIMKKRGQNSYSSSLLKALTILDQFAGGSELGIKELSTATGIPPSTVQRIVNTFVLHGYLEQNAETLKYNLSASLYHITSAFMNKRKWVDLAKPLMEHLVGLHRETVNLGILKNNHVVYLSKADSPEVLRPNFTVGTGYPALDTSLGRCLLAWQPEEVWENCFTSYHLTNERKRQYELLLSEIRENGYAMEDEQFQIGLFCIAAPVFSRNRKITAAISMTIPKARLSFTKLPSMIDDIRKTAAQISEIAL